jgi:VanZ family protein
LTLPKPDQGGPGPRGRALFLFYWLPVVAYTGLIFSGSSIKARDLPTLLPYMDKVAHLMEYSLFGMLLGRAIRATFTRGSAFAVTVAAVGLGAAVGCMDEIYQRFVPGRQSDPLDWLTDLAAVTLGTVLVQVVHARPIRWRGHQNNDANR